MNATAKRTTARKVVTTKKAIVKVDITKLTEKQLNALPEDVFLASLKPSLRKSVEAAFRLKGVL